MLSYRDRKRIRETSEYQRTLTPTPDTGHRRGRWWEYLNSPFMIWLFSAVVIGLVASVSSDQQNCQAQVSQNSERFTRLSAEVRQREIRFFDALIAANSPDELNRTLVLIGPAAPYRYLEFKDRTLAELEDEYAVLQLKLHPSSAWDGSQWDTTKWSTWPKATDGSVANAQVNILRDIIDQYNATATFELLLDSGSVDDLRKLRQGIPELQRMRAQTRYTDRLLAAGAQCSLWQSIKNRFWGWL